MKKRLLILVTVVIFSAGGSINAYSLQQDCPDKGTAKCRLVKDCMDKGTDECRKVTKGSIPPCCQKPQKNSTKKVPSKM